MSYYWFNIEKFMKNAWDKYHNKGGKQKASESYRKNADLIKLETRNKYKNLSEKEKNKKRQYQREKHHINTDLKERLKQYQRNYYASKQIRKNNLFDSIKDE